MSSNLLDRTPPHNNESEQGVLGSILLQPQIIDEVALILRPDHFYDEAHRVLYRTFLDMNDRNRQIDVSLLVTQLKRDGAFEQIGGAAAIARFAQAVPNAAHAIHYSRIVDAAAGKRAVIEAGTQMIATGYDEQVSWAQALEQSEARMSEVSLMRVDSTATVRDIRDVLGEAIDTIDARTRGEVTAGIPTGFEGLDNLIGGLRPGNLLVIVARPGQGKTALAMQLARNAAEHGSVLFFSLEMSDQELAERMLSQESHVDSYRLRNGHLTDEQRRTLVAAAGRLALLQLRTEDMPNRTANAIAAICRRESRRPHGLGLVVIDYLQLLQPENTRDPRQEQIAKMSRRLKLLARELNIPLVLVAQLNRESEKTEGAASKPKLSHLRESGAIEQDCDICLMLWHAPDSSTEDIVNEPQAEILVRKNRMGPTGEVRVGWHDRTTRFLNLDRRHADEEPAWQREPDEPQEQQGEFF